MAMAMAMAKSDVRSRVIRVLVKPKEKTRIVDKAQRSKQSVSDYFRSLALADLGIKP